MSRKKVGRYIFTDDIPNKITEHFSISPDFLFSAENYDNGPEYRAIAFVFWAFLGRNILEGKFLEHSGPQRTCYGTPIPLNFTLSEEGTRWRSWLRYCATSREVAGSIPRSAICNFR